LDVFVDPSWSSEHTCFRPAQAPFAFAGLYPHPPETTHIQVSSSGRELGATSRVTPAGTECPPYTLGPFGAPSANDQTAPIGGRLHLVPVDPLGSAIVQSGILRTGKRPALQRSSGCISCTVSQQDDSPTWPADRCPSTSRPWGEAGGEILTSSIPLYS